MTLVTDAAVGLTPERRERLHRLFAPRSIAVIGAKDNGRLFMGTGAVLQALERIGFTGDIHLVNRSGTPVYGTPATRTAAEVGARVDMAAVLVPAAAIPEVIPDIAAAGAVGITCLASGLSESGPEGARLQDEIAAAARAAGLDIIGPNCLGYLNFVERAGVWFSGTPVDVTPGPVAIVSQSGGVGDALMEMAVNFGVGLSHLITTGNELTITVADAMEYLVELESTRSLAVFAEAIRSPETLVRVARRARELGKGIVMLKAGASELGARNAVSHTGSLAGDDVVTDAVLRQLGVVRVDSLEALITTAHLIAQLSPAGAGGLGVVSLSGGSCSIIADTAASAGLDLPAFSPETARALGEIAGPFASPQNPFDVTAAAGDSTFADCLAVLDAQVDISAIAVICNVPTHASGATPDVIRLLESIGRGMASIATPSVLLSQTAGHLQAFGRASLAQADIAIALPGVDLGTRALERWIWWSAAVRAEPSRLLTEGPIAKPLYGGADLVVSEWEARSVVEGAGVTAVPATLAFTADSAVAAAIGYGASAVKANSSRVAHKSDIGAVKLNVVGETAVREAFDAVRGAVIDAVGADAFEGVLVTPMRAEGVELVVGVNPDPVWGPSLVVGLGGIFVETLRDVSVRALPVSDAEIGQMLDGLAGRAVLTGARGRAPVDRAALVAAIGGIAQAGSRSDVVSVEVNPLLASPSSAEALDALVVMAGAPA